MTASVMPMYTAHGWQLSDSISQDYVNTCVSAILSSQNLSGDLRTGTTVPLSGPPLRTGTVVAMRADTYHNLCVQGSVPPGQQMSRDQAAGMSNGRAGRETPQRSMRQHSELPFHSSGRTNPNPERRSQPQTPHPIPDRSRPDSRPKQKASADPQAASGSTSEARGLDKQHSLGHNVSRYGSSTSDARLEQRSSSRQHSRQKSRPSPARP